MADKSLIIGAGAMGLFVGYNLSIGGSLVDFLVRPHKLDKVVKPTRLYCYDDSSVRSFVPDSVISNLSSSPINAYDFIVMTLAGDVLMGAEGTQLLIDIGNFIRDSDSIIVNGSMGPKVSRYILEKTKVSPDRVVDAGLSVFCHQVQGADLPLHEPTDAMLLASCDVAYRHLAPSSLYLSAANAPAAERFLKIYNRSTASMADMLSQRDFELIFSCYFPVVGASQLLGWPTVRDLRQHAEIGPLIVAAMNEIISLQTQEIGEGLDAEMLLDRWEKNEAACLPLDFAAFNAFHHGAKVRSQDIGILFDLVELGDAKGLAMKALRTLADKWRAFDLGHTGH